MKPEIQNCLTWMMNRVAEATMYNWSDEFAIKELKEGSKGLYEELKKYIDLTKLTIEEAKELRFMRWDDESDIFLFPLWIVPLIPDGLEVTTIFGEKEVYNSTTADNDIRFGCVAYGLEIKE